MYGKKKGIWKWAGILMLIIGITSIYGLSGVARHAHGATSSSFQGPVSFADLADRVKHSVVNIATTQVVQGAPLAPFFGPNSPFNDDFFKRFFGQVPQAKRKTHALGSGFVIDRKGLIITNNHVVEKATEIKVKLDDGHEYTATILGRDPKTDLALLKVTPDEHFPEAVELGDSDAIRVGDWVMAVGNPFGLGHTVTTGIIGAKSRIIGAGPYDDFLQTDAAINPGNSGGPLFNMQGQVVGINTAIVAQGQGIGFAIPSNMARELLPQLEAGKIVRGWLGVGIQDLTPELAKSFDLEDSKGAVVTQIFPGSPADQAGLEQGDVITTFNGKSVEDGRELSRMVASTTPETRVEITVVRNGKTKDLSVTLGNMPSEAVMAQGATEQSGAYGLEIQELTPALAQQLELDASQKGVVVTSVEPGSPADEAGIRQGDVITEVNRHAVASPDDYCKALEKGSKDEGVLFLIKRGNGSTYIVLEPEQGE